MTIIYGPHRPELETLQEYIERVVRDAPAPSPEQYSRLAALLPIGVSSTPSRQDGGSDAAA